MMLKISLCHRCGKEGKTYSPVKYPLKVTIEEAEQKLGIKATEPFKGVKALMSRDKSSRAIRKRNITTKVQPVYF